MTDQYILKYKYLVYKLYPKFKHDSLYMNVDTKGMFDLILSTTSSINKNTSSYSSLCPFPIVIDRLILNPSKKQDYLLILTLFPFILLQTFLLDRSEYNEEHLDAIIKDLDRNYNDETVDSLHTFLSYIYNQSLEEPYFRSLSIIFYSFSKLKEQYPSYGNLYETLKEKLNNEYDFY